MSQSTGPEIILGQLRDRCHVTREPWKVDGRAKLKVALWRANGTSGHAEVDHVILESTASDADVQAVAQNLRATC